MSNNQKISRRSFTKVLAASAALGVTACSAPSANLVNSGGKKVVVVIGGGFGGATAAKYVKKFGHNVHVVLIEKKSTYHTCPFSNMVLAGEQPLSSVEHTYGALQHKYGVQFVQAMVKKVDAKNSKVILADGRSISYDKVVVSPGIDFKWDSIPGHSKEASEFEAPHAYQAGPQTETLREQLVNMKNGGTFVLIPPTNPFRCPPGPYERASLIAHYFKKHKPKSKLIILDQKDKFSKFGLFKEGWAKNYSKIIDWRAKSKGGQVKHIDTVNKIIKTVSGKTIKADVINLIPAQKAGKLAFDSGLTKGDWCPINPLTFESTIHKNVYVIGDSSIAKAMPKSGFSANSQAKLMAIQLTRTLEGKHIMNPPKFANTCYSLITPSYGISVTKVYQANAKMVAKIKGSGGLSPMNASKDFRKAESLYARGWYRNITDDIFG